MPIPYSQISEAQENYSSNSAPESSEHSNPYTTTAPIAVAAHIRLFYRVFVKLILLFIPFTVGIAAILVANIKSDSCPAANSLPKWLNAFGIVDAIMCVVVAISVCISIYLSLARLIYEKKKSHLDNLFLQVMAVLLNF